MNTTEKKKLHFNIIDVLLIVIVLAVATTLFFFLRDHRVVADATGERVEIVYKIEVSAMREEFRNLVLIGDEVIDAETLDELGEVLNVTYADGTYLGTDAATGRPVVSNYPGRLTMTLTVAATAYRTDTGYRLGDRELILNGDLPFRTPDFTGTATCLEIRVASESEG